MKKSTFRSAQNTIIDPCFHFTLTTTPLVLSPIPYMIDAGVRTIIGTLLNKHKKSYLTTPGVRKTVSVPADLSAGTVLVSLTLM